jgi:hypothetical protein
MVIKPPTFEQGLIPAEECIKFASIINDFKAMMPDKPVWDETDDYSDMPQTLGFGKILNSRMGKIYFQIPIVKIPSNILDLVTKAANDFEPGVEIHSVTYTEYSSEYGTPSLSYHTDRTDDLLLVDLQISSNTIWPLGANGELYDMNDGDALVIRSGSTVHGRPEKIFNPGEHVAMIFFDFLRQQ